MNSAISVLQMGQSNSKTQQFAQSHPENKCRNISTEVPSGGFVGGNLCENRLHLFTLNVLVGCSGISLFQELSD